MVKDKTKGKKTDGYSVVLATGTPVLANGLAALAADALPQKPVIDMAPTFAAAAARLRAKEDQMLILDLDMLVSGGIRDRGAAEEAMRWPDRYPLLKMIVLYSRLGMAPLQKWFVNGAAGVLGKSSSLEEAMSCMREVFNGRLYIEKGRLLQLIKAGGDGPAENGPRMVLTGREKAVAGLLVQGMRNTEIAAILKLHTSTVSTFKHHVFKKLQVKNLLELESHRAIRMIKN